MFLFTLFQPFYTGDKIFQDRVGVISFMNSSIWKLSYGLVKFGQVEIMLGKEHFKTNSDRIILLKRLCRTSDGYSVANQNSF